MSGKYGDLPLQRWRNYHPELLLTAFQGRAGGLRSLPAPGCRFDVFDHAHLGSDMISRQGRVGWGQAGDAASVEMRLATDTSLGSSSAHSARERGGSFFLRTNYGYDRPRPAIFQREITYKATLSVFLSPRQARRFLPYFLHKRRNYSSC